MENWSRSKTRDLHSRVTVGKKRHILEIVEKEGWTCTEKPKITNTDSAGTEPDKEKTNEKTCN
ncbi:Hypothetical protein CINCED_3A002602, partial [Cinara cedri]